MKNTIQFDIHNRFDITLVDAKTGNIKETYTAYNVVLDNFYSQILNKNSIYDNNTIDRFLIGTGTGTLSTDRQSLFQYLADTTATLKSVEFLDNGLNVVVYSGTFSETQAIGELTEIGFSGSRTSGINVYTHSLITDSEGNSISINKTNADILYVKGTIYSKITNNGPLKFYRVSNHGRNIDARNAQPIRLPVSCCEDTAYSGGWKSSTFNSTGMFTMWSLSGWDIWNPGQTPLAIEACGMTNPIESYYNWASYVWNNTSNLAPAAETRGSNLDATTIRLTSNIMESTKGNYPSTWFIKSMKLRRDYVGLGYFTFPNPELYPVHEFTFTLAGDGVTTDFELPLPEVLTEGIEIRINDTILGSEEYTFSGKNFNMTQAWISADNRYMIQTGLIQRANPSGGSRSGDSWVTPVFPTFPGDFTYAQYDEPIVYDFETPRKVNTFKMQNVSMRNIRISEDCDLEFRLSYSHDQSDWVEVASQSVYVLVGSKTTYDPNIDFEQTFEPVEARYWKIDILPNFIPPTEVDVRTLGNYMRTKPGVSDPQTILFCGFDYVEPDIHFNTPPEEGATITVKCQCEYPIMNENWRIDPIVMDISIVRSES